MKPMKIIVLLFLTSCSLFMSQRERLIQTEIISKISAKAPLLAKCAKQSQLFEKFQQDRVRVVMTLTINSDQQIERFSLDRTDYPEDFSNCAFQIVDLIAYPSIENHELIKVEQPFIFSKK
jgi:hypothetical protein